MIGQKFGLVTVVERDPERATGLGTIKYLVKCECGSHRWLRGNNIRHHPPKTHRFCNRGFHKQEQTQ